MSLKHTCVLVLVLWLYCAPEFPYAKRVIVVDVGGKSFFSGVQQEGWMCFRKQDVRLFELPAEEEIRRCQPRNWERGPDTLKERQKNT